MARLHRCHVSSGGGERERVVGGHAVAGVEHQAVGDVGQRVAEVGDLEVDERAHLGAAHDPVHEPGITEADRGCIVGTRRHVVGEPVERGDLSRCGLGRGNGVEQRRAPVLDHVAHTTRADARGGHLRCVDGMQRGERVVERLPDHALDRRAARPQLVVGVIPERAGIGDHAAVDVSHHEARTAGGARAVVDCQHLGQRHAETLRVAHDVRLADGAALVHDARLPGCLQHHRDGAARRRRLHPPRPARVPASEAAHTDRRDRRVDLVGQPRDELRRVDRELALAGPLAVHDALPAPLSDLVHQRGRRVGLAHHAHVPGVDVDDRAVPDVPGEARLLVWGDDQVAERPDPRARDGLQRRHVHGLGREPRRLRDQPLDAPRRTGRRRDPRR